MPIWVLRMIDPLSLSIFLATMMSGGGAPNTGAEVASPPAAVEAVAEIPSGPLEDFYTGASLCSKFLAAGGDVSVLQGDSPARRIIPGTATAVFFPAMGDAMRFVISADDSNAAAPVCSGTGPASPTWEAFKATELAVLKPILAQDGLAQLDFPADPVLFADCQNDVANIYFIFSPGGPGGVVFAGNTGAQAESFCGLYGRKG